MTNRTAEAGLPAPFVIDAFDGHMQQHAASVLCMPLTRASRGTIAVTIWQASCARSSTALKSKNNEPI